MLNNYCYKVILIAAISMSDFVLISIYSLNMLFLLSLAAGAEGAFLVRESNTSPGDYVLSVLHDVRQLIICHYHIR